MKFNVLLGLTFVALVLGVSSQGAAQSSESKPQEPASNLLPPYGVGLGSIPLPDTSKLEAAVKEQIESLQAAVREVGANPATPPAQLLDAYAALGQIYQLYEYHRSAEASYLNAIRLAPKDKRWIHLLGTVYRKEGNLDLARLYFEEVRRIDPAYVAAAVYLGDLDLESNQLEPARQHFEEALKVAPGSPAALVGLGQADLREKRFAEALERFQAALEKVPDANRVHYFVAMAYRGLKETDKAREHLAQSGRVGIRPPDPVLDSLQGLARGERVYIVRGQVAFNAGRFEEAAQAYVKAVEAAPQNWSARVNLGASLARLKLYDEAIEQFQEAIKINPSSKIAHFNLASLLARAGRRQEALSHYKISADADPKDFESNMESARLMVQLGHSPQEAQEYAEKAWKANPGHEDALILHVNLLSRLQRHSEALELLQMANKRMPGRGAPSHAEARLLAASPILSDRDGQRALELALAVYDARKTIEHGRTVAMALAELGRCDEAAQWQKRMIDVAEHGGDSNVLGTLQRALALFESGSECRPPGREQEEK